MTDRFMNGIIAGTAGAIVMNTFDLLSYWLFRTIRFLDFAAVFIYESKPTFWWDTIFALLVQIVFSATLTLFFIYLLPYLKVNNYLFKGLLFGGSSWFIIYTIVKIYKIPLLYNTPWQTTTSNIFTSAIFGIVVIMVIKWLYQGKEEWSRVKK